MALQDQILAREDHYMTAFGAEYQKVWHSRSESSPVHVDVYPFEAAPGREYLTLITGGMSSLRQDLPPGSRCPARTELVTWTPKAHPWLVNWLVHFATVPWRQSTYVLARHTSGGDGKIFAGTKHLSAFLFVEPPELPAGLSPMFVEEEPVEFLLMVPITESERIFARENGSKALIETFRTFGFNLILNEDRESLVEV